MLRPFSGFGIELLGNYQFIKQDVPKAPEIFEMSRSIGMGTNFVFGIEYFIVNELSITSEYSFGLKFKYSESSEDDFRTLTKIEKVYSSEIITLGLLVCFYF